VFHPVIPGQFLVSLDSPLQAERSPTSERMLRELLRFKGAENVFKMHSRVRLRCEYVSLKV